MGLFPKMVEKPNPKSKLSKNIEDFASRSTIHGVSYVVDQTVPIIDRFLWMAVCLSSATLAVILIHSSYSDWQDNQVITSLKTVAKPVADLNFPAVTICAAGQHMGNVEKVIFYNFKQWEQSQPILAVQKTLEEKFEDYMEETFQIRERGLSILDILNTMISPSNEATGANAIRQNELACSAKNKRQKRSTIQHSTSN